LGDLSDFAVFKVNTIVTDSKGSPDSKVTPPGYIMESVAHYHSGLVSATTVRLGLGRFSQSAWFDLSQSIAPSGAIVVSMSLGVSAALKASALVASQHIVPSVIRGPSHTVTLTRRLIQSMAIDF
jgi:hypothetical protein